MKTTILILSILSAMLSPVLSAQTSNITSKNNYFVENKGQWPNEVLYFTQLPSAKVWITRNGVVYDYHQYELINPRTFEKINAPHEQDEYIVHGQLIKVEFESVNTTSVSAQDGNKCSGYHNYFLGNNPENWASNVGLYFDVFINNLYPGIDVHYYFDSGKLRYDYLLAPGTDASMITLNVKGAESVSVNKNGELTYQTRFGEVREGNLFAFQNVAQIKKPVACKYAMNGNSIVLNLGAYDKNKALVIDPLVYSTFIGGTNMDYSYGIKVHSNGNYSIAGHTYSNDFPTGPVGTYDATFNDFKDIFVTQFLESGASFVYSTYIGGSGSDDCFAMAIDGSDNIYLTGASNSSNYPVTSGAFQFVKNSGNDVIVTKLNSTGTALVYSTFIGHSGNDVAYGIDVDGSGNAYICGYSDSQLYPTANPVQQWLAAANYTDAIVTKLNATGTALVYSTYLGGYVDDYARDIFVHNDGIGDYAYVVGYTYSTSFPTTGAYQATLAGGCDAFLVKFEPNGTIGFSTYYGGTNDDWATTVVVRDDGLAYFAGYTSSNNLPVTPDCYDNSFNGGQDAYIAVISFVGNALNYATYIGGSSYDIISEIYLDDAGYDICFIGGSASANFPVSSNAYDNSLNNANAQNYDVVFGKLGAYANGPLHYSSFIGGSYADNGYALDVKNSNFYMTGVTESPNFPTSNDAYDSSQNPEVTDVFVTIVSVCNALNVSINNSSNVLTVGEVSATYQWIDCNNSNAPITGATAQSYTPTQTGSYAVIVTKNGCSQTSSCVTVNISSIDENDASNALLVYPNPASQNVFVSVPSQGRFEVYSIEGRLIYSKELQKDINNINIFDWSTGVYFVQFTSTDGYVCQSRFIKE